MTMHIHIKNIELKVLETDHFAFNTAWLQSDVISILHRIPTAETKCMVLLHVFAQLTYNTCSSRANTMRI